MRPTTIDSKKQKPKIFIGSSTESLKYARAIKAQLQDVAAVEVWNEDRPGGIWKPGKSVLGNLVDQLPDYDFAILILGDEDITVSRQVVTNVPRDNVIFELGLFMGHLGRFRTFFLRRKGTDLKIPSNLDGIKYISFEGTQSKKAIEKACDTIRHEIEKQGIRPKLSALTIKGPGPIKGPGHVVKAVLKWMELSKAAREKLAHSQFIRNGETGEALLSLVNSAKKNDSILAICGYKGSFSKLYYKKNFEKCKAVSRVFSYEAIRSEIKGKNRRYALDGLKMHLNRKPTDKCDVEVILIPKNKSIKSILGGRFDPPLSFGLAILLDAKKSPKKAVVHWEMDAEPLRDLIAIEGIIIDVGQQEVLRQLVKLFGAISGSDDVLSYKNYKPTSAEDKKKMTDLGNELEKIAKSRSRMKQ